MRQFDEYGPLKKLLCFLGLVVLAIIGRGIIYAVFVEGR